MTKKFGTLALFLCITFARPALADPISIETLLHEMIDLPALATFPDPAYVTKQFSSYDQRSTDRAVLTDENWFANGDRGQHLRAEERNGATEHVLMDAEGPGAIVRFWSANPADAGVLRIYLDGEDTPVIEVSLEDYLGGKTEYAPKPIAGERSRGWNSHLPIPYAKHCKVTTSKPDFYYQINYRSYGAGTEVKSFSVKQTKAAAKAYKEVSAAIEDPAAYAPEHLTKEKDFGFEGEVRGGGELPVVIADGAQAFTQILCAVEAADLAAALRGAVIRIYYDGEKTPRVEAPLGDFFGTAPGINAYASLNSGVLPDNTLYSRWVMPFHKGAAIVLTNTTEATLNVKMDVHSMPWKWDKNSLYFHAKWRAEHDIKTRPRQDWNYVTVQGRGRFVGDMLHISNPVPAWWGEGDEKIYVDGEAFPSHFGTGTEDYYGYAWCDNQPFTHAYHNQPHCDGPANYGNTCVSRYHIIDDIPFTTSFQFDMEVWHWEDCIIDQSAISYWYADRTSTNNVSAPDPALLIVPEIAALPEPKRVEGALEGEKLEVISKTGGNLTVQNAVGWGWSANEQVWWTEPAPGDKLTLGFTVETAGTYEVAAVFTKAGDYGIANLYINGALVAKEMDFYNNGVVATPEIGLATLELKAGRNEFTVEITGSNAMAEPKHMAGLDYLILRAPAATP